MKLIKLLSVLIVALVITNITLTNRSVDESVYASSLSHQIKILEDDNMLISSRIALMGSLPVISEKIKSAGFFETPLVVALPTPSSVALR